MTIELELGVLLFIQLLGTSFFARFEVETPALRKVLKWIFLHGVTIALYYFVGHYAIAFPIFLIALGSVVHFRFCRKNGIDPIKATPRKKYYELRGWMWLE